MTADGSDAALSDDPGPSDPTTPTTPDTRDERPLTAGPSRRRHGIVALMALVAFWALFAVVAPRDSFGWETDVVVEATQLPDAVGSPLRLVMQLGRRALVPLVALVVLVVGRRVWPAVAVLLAGFVAGQTVGLLKEWASRPRPDGVRVREAADGFGFPSGHSAVAWAVAVVVATQLPPRWRWAPLVVASLVAGARMNAGVHHPLDVAGGSLWGVVVGATVVAVVGDDLRPRPGRPDG